MKRKSIVLVYFFICFSGCPNIHANENIRISSGGEIRAAGPVKFIGIGAPVAGRGKSPIVGVGLPYMGKASAQAGGMHKSARVAASIAKPESISSAFVLGEVYVYPNPAKGGQIPVFHIEVGIADSVKITIYTVSGDVVHNYTITAAPSAINDGHGLEYAYEYAWRGHIPSGVYYYAIEAKKAEKKLRKTGKLAVIR